MAWRKLSALYFNVDASRVLQVDAATRAFEHRDRLPPLERYLTEGFYYTNANRQADQAIAAYRRALDIAPNDPTAINNLGLVLNVTGQFAAAESVLRRGMGARQPSMSMADNLVDALASQRKWSAVDTVFLEADRASRPDHPSRYLIRINAAMARRDYPRAESLVTAHEGRPGGALPIPPVLYSRIDLDMLHGHYAHARRVLQELSDSALAAGERGDAADAAVAPVLMAGELGSPADARRALDAALAGPAFRGLDSADVPLLDLARAYAVLGDAEGVRRQRRLLEAREPLATWRPRESSRWDGIEAEAAHRWRDAAVAYSAVAMARSCAPCDSYRAGKMWDAAGQADSAIAYYRHGTDRPPLNGGDEEAYLYPLALRRLGALYEERGNRAQALEWYTRFLDLWHDADPDLQPVVRDIRGRVSRLTAEPRSP
jgi:tetratricopeptide (TPR) repeat protein